MTRIIGGAALPRPELVQGSSSGEEQPSPALTQNQQPPVSASNYKRKEFVYEKESGGGEEESPVNHDPELAVRQGGYDPELEDITPESRVPPPHYFPKVDHGKPPTNFYFINGWMHLTNNHPNYPTGDLFACKDSKDWTPAMIGAAAGTFVCLVVGGALTTFGAVGLGGAAGRIGMTVGGVVGLVLGIVFFCYCCAKSFSVKD